MTDVNKVEYGIEQLAVFEITESNGTITYGDAVPLVGAKSFTIDAQGESTDFYADNSVWFTHSPNSGYSGKLNFIHNSDEIGVTLFGDLETSDGGLMEVTNGKPKRFGVAFQCLGDVENVRHQYLNVTFGRGSSETTTTEDGVTLTEYTVPYTASPVRLASGELVPKIKFKETDAGYETALTSMKLPTKKTTGV